MAEEEIRVDLIGAGGNVRTRHIPGFAGAVTALVRLGRRGMGGLRGQPTSSPRNPGPESALPLNVFHVLEEEYIALHGELPHIPGRGWDVAPDQVLDTSTIGRGLADAAAGSAQATAFSRHVHGLLEAQWDEARLRNLTVAELVELLNELLSKRNLYDPRAVATVELRGETQECVRVYANANFNGLGDEDLRRFNRLLLEDAYPAALRRINEVRLAAIVAQRYAKPTAALCLSGGGIRSGTFSLGVLQGLARRGLLPSFHYLSTVSGGGYIGSWLTAWCHRHPRRLSGVVDELKNPSPSKLEPEPDPLRQLRDYSSFTAPRPSLMSADVWSFAAIYLRNLLINWSALIPPLLAVLLIPRIVTALFYARHVASGAARRPGAEAMATPELAWLFYGLLLAGFGLSVLSVFYITINRPSRADLLPPGSWWRKRRTQGAFLRYSLLPGVVAGWCLSTFWAWARAGDVPPAPTLGWLVEGAARWPLLGLLIVLGIGIYAVAIAVASIVLRSGPTWADLTAAFFTGLGGGLLTWLPLRTAFASPVPPPGRVLPTAAWYTVLAIPAYLMILFGAASVFVAATSKRRATSWNAMRFAIEDEDREWLGRHGGWLFLAAVAWAILSGLVLFGPLGLLMSPKVLGALGGVSGVAAALGGKSAFTSATGKDAAGQGWKALLVNHLLSIVAALFIGILIAALSLFTSWGLASLVGAIDGASAVRYRPTALLIQWASESGVKAIEPGWVAGSTAWTALAAPGQFAILYFSPAWLVAGLALLAAGAGLLAGWVINLNKFSLHAAYRSRIIRAFLGASRPTAERVPNPFTGFDPQDNIQMHELRPGLLREASFTPGGLTALVDKLAASQHTKRDEPPTPSQELYTHLSMPTQRMLRRHSTGNPPSQSLKRNLLEDLNRLLEDDPGLLGLDAFASRPSSPRTQAFAKLVAARIGGTQPGGAGESNGALAQSLPPHGRSNALLVLNRSVLDSVYPDEIQPLEGPPPPYRLLHVVGTALNLVGGKRLAWQERRAESFTISPLHCGSLFRGYRRSRLYGGVDGVSLGTAVTISGAAVSSNMGYHSSAAAVTFVLTLFNARLGWWLGNPGAAGGDRSYATRLTEPPYQRSFPRLSLAPLAMEAFGLTDDTSRYVLLSDGGHFDNLGLYEMVLRRCRFIVAVDGSQDEHFTFEDLGATVRKIRIDLGVEITFDGGAVPIYAKESPEVKAGKGRYCAVATIHYPEGDGVLVYIKPTILGNEPRDVLQYAAANPAFPHQATLDQFFDESQFESYRRLGVHTVDTICRAFTEMTFPQFIDCASEHVGTTQTSPGSIRGCVPEPCR